LGFCGPGESAPKHQVHQAEGLAAKSQEPELRSKAQGASSKPSKASS
jgi:hypothetical protein